MNDDPRTILANSRMGAFQIAAVGVCVLLNALDGFDVLSVSFASPGIAAEWGVNRGALGIVLSMELIGMAIGSIFIGSIADVIGRRPVILGSLACMVAGMFLAATASGIEILSAYRFFTGLGIGGMLASINAMAAEYSNARHKSLAVTIMAAGYPVGAIIGGAISSALLEHYDWRSVFLFGAAATASFFPLVWFLLPEAIEFLTHKRPAGALEKINHTLTRMGHPTVSALPAVSGVKEKHVGVAKLFSPALARTTVLLTVTYFMHILTFYFMLKWIPKIVVDMGFAASAAGGVLVWANVGGASGAFLLGLLTQRFGVRGLVIGSMIAGFFMVVLFGMGQADLKQLSLIAAIAVFFINAAIVGLYAIFAQTFPTDVRAGGTGFVIGVGRGGAALGPIIAGFLFQGGAPLPAVAGVMACGTLIAAGTLFMLRPLPVAGRASSPG